MENASALVAYGVGQDGHRKLLGISIGSEESEASWSKLLAELVAAHWRRIRSNNGLERLHGEI